VAGTGAQSPYLMKLANSKHAIIDARHVPARGVAEMPGVLPSGYVKIAIENHHL